MSDHKATIIRWFEEVWNQGRRETIDELLAEDCVIHDGDSDATGPEEFKAFFDRLQAAFSEIHITPRQAISEGNFACLRWSATMRHTGNALGMLATQKLLHTSGISIGRFKDGRFVEAWQNWDMLGVIQQITDEAASAKVYMGTPTKPAVAPDR